MREPPSSRPYTGTPHSTALDAYGADLSACPDLALSADAAEWIRLASILERAIALRGEARTAYLLTALAQIGGIDPVERLGVALARQSLRVADAAEDGQAFALAMTILDLGRALVPRGEASWHGRILIQQARILRKLGEIEAASRLLDEVLAAAAAGDDRHLEARARIGKGVLAQVRGNYPELRTQYGAVLTLADDSRDGRELRRLAHHGLLVASATARDFDSALWHGDKALALAESAGERVEIQLNLAAVCYDVGEFRSALHANLLALREARTVRVQLPAVGGAALAAARLGDRSIVEALGSRAERLIGLTGNEHAVADMSRELFEAFSVLGDTERAARFREEAWSRASRGGYHEISHRLETFVVPALEAPRAARSAVSNDAWAIADRLAAGSSEELLIAAIGGTGG